MGRGGEEDTEEKEQEPELESEERRWKGEGEELERKGIKGGGRELGERKGMN